MGCCSSRPSKLEGPESRFILGEAQLKYHVHDVKHIYSVHTSHSTSKSISPDQLLEISKVLHLGYSQKSSPVFPTLEKFYDSFKTGEGYKTQDLITLALLQSHGQDDLKAYYLFQTFKHGESGEMEKHSVGRLHDTLFKVTVKRILLILKDDPKQKIEPTESLEFLKNLKDGREDFREHFIMSIVGDGESVSEEGFVNWFKDPKNAGILTSSGFRKALSSYSPSNHHQKSYEGLTVSVKV